MISVALIWITTLFLHLTQLIDIIFILFIVFLIIIGYEVDKYLNKKKKIVDTQKRINILEMLLWKYHTKEIPNDVYQRLIKNGYLIKNPRDNTSGWSKETDDLGKQFNDAFDFEDHQFRLDKFAE
jgi:preprotein translocase subunit SecA